MAELRVRVQPRASRDEIAGRRGDELVVRVTAPPVDGRANEAVRRLVAKALHIAPTRVAVARGASGRHKLLRIDGLSDAALRRTLADGS